MKRIKRKLASCDAARTQSEHSIVTEIRVLRDFPHPNLVHLYDVVETKHSVRLVLEWMPRGDLFEVGPDVCLWKVIRDVARALEWLHQNRIVHRDVKEENVLVGDPNKLCDLGLALVMGNADVHYGLFSGTPGASAPEMLLGYTRYASDAWSLGVLLFERLTGQSPFGRAPTGTPREVDRVSARVRTGVYRWPRGKRTYDPRAVDLVQRLLVLEPTKRLTMKQVLRHPYVCRSDLSPLTPQPPVPDRPNAVEKSAGASPDSARTPNQSAVPILPG